MLAEKALQGETKDTQWLLIKLQKLQRLRIPYCVFRICLVDSGDTLAKVPALRETKNTQYAIRNNPLFFIEILIVIIRLLAC